MNSSGHSPDAPKSKASRMELIRRQREIGRGLRQLFDDVVKEPVPDEFLRLLAQLDSSASAADKKAAEDASPTPGEDEKGGR